LSLKSKIAMAAAAAAFTLAAGGAALAQGAKGLEPFEGHWMMNASKTQMGRMGPNGNNIRRSPTFTWTFTPKDYGLEFDVYNQWPQDKPTRTMTMIVDGKQHPCPGPNPCLTTGGDPSKQTYAYTRLDDHMLARLFYENGQVVEYSSYSVSKDGKTLSIVSWSPDTPEYHNIQVFDKQP
jgi:hypothetical protein